MRRRLSSDAELKIRELIAAGVSDQEIARRCAVSAPTVAVRRKASAGPAGDQEHALSAAVVVSALRHLASSSGLTAPELADRMGIPSCARLISALISLGVVRQSTDDPPRYGLRRDWL